MNIELPDTAKVRTVVVVVTAAYNYDVAHTSIRVGNDANSRNNPICSSSIDKDGVYLCPVNLAGKFVGVERTGQTSGYGWREIWAYSWDPFDENNSLLSSD
jgi:hypothetical protein